MNTVPRIRETKGNPPRINPALGSSPIKQQIPKQPLGQIYCNLVELAQTADLIGMSSIQMTLKTESGGIITYERSANSGSAKLDLETHPRRE